MNSPFTDFIDVASESLTAFESDMEVKGPFKEIQSYDSYNFPHEEDRAPDIAIENELTGDELTRAVQLNAKYSLDYKWRNYVPQILNLIGAQSLAFSFDPVTFASKFAQAFADWQDKNGYKTDLKGVLGLNNWTYFQKKLGLHNLSNKHNINLSKAISGNNYYSKKLWGSEKENVYRYLQDNKIVAVALPLNDEYFAYAIADFQALKGLTVDGILGPTTLASLHKTVPAIPFTPHATLTPSRWRTIIPDAVQSPAEPLVNGNDAFKEIARVIKTAKANGHYIYLLSGWVADIDFCLSPNENKSLAGMDTSSSLRNLFTQAANAGVEIKILSWNNPKTLTDLANGERFINELRAAGKNAMMFRDNFTYGTEFIKGLMSKVQYFIKALSLVQPSLNFFQFWKDLKAKVNAFPNQGSHHEKILVVNGTEGLIAFCGGMDINSDRVIGLKGLCCNNLIPFYDCDLEETSGKKMRSRILDDVHCKLKGRAAETLLQRFIYRWNLHLSQNIQSIPKMADHVSGPNVPVTADTPYVKVLHTFNHPVNKSIRDRSILNMVERVIKNARKIIDIECQYMISPEIASWLNTAVRENRYLHVNLYTQDDEIAGADLMFPHYFRRRFREKLLNGLRPDEAARIKTWMLDPLSDPPNRRRVHSKTYIIDEELAIIGSANCNRRSMTFDSETAVVLFQDGEPSQSIVKTLRDKIRNDKYNKWIEYKENFSIEALDLDSRIKMSPYFIAPVAILSVPLPGIAGWSADKLLAIISALLREVIDPHPEDEPNITKEVETELAEFSLMNDNELTELPDLAELNIDENSPFRESFDSLSYNHEDQQPHTDCSCHQKTNGFTKRDLDIAEVIEQQVAVINKSCEGRTCWAKSVLNNLSGLSLAINNTLDEQTKNAISDFQIKNNLPQTKRVDAATERALLEADAIQRNKGTTLESAAVNIISTAKSKIEDWTGKAVNTKPQYILDSYRDPRKLWAFVLHQMAFKRRGRISKLYSDPTSYLSTGAHFCIMLDGRIIQLHPLSRFIWHAQCASTRSVAVEFEGNFPNVQGRWWVDSTSSFQNKDVPTQAQYEAGRFLTSYLKTILGTTHILAHRQSSDSRENDPGPDIWYNVGQWAVDNLALTDGGPTFKCGTGKPILPAWKTWGNKTALVKEFSEYDAETGETEWQSEDENVTDELIVEPEADYESNLYTEVSDEESYTDMQDFVNDLTGAIAKNRYYADKLGWNQYQYQINDLLLPYSGQQNVSLGEEAFAQAIAAWQQQQGFAAKDCDGIIGPNTWAKMRSLFVTQPTTTTTPTQINTLPANIDSRVVARLRGFSTDIESISNQYGLNPNIVRGIIAAESGGNPDSGKGTTGYEPGISIQTGVKKFILFRDKILNPWFARLQIAIPPATDEIYLKACLSCYNAGPVTAMKAIQYAHAAGNWKNWLSAEYYLRALLFSGGYDKYSKCNQGLSTIAINAAKAEGLKYKFKTKNWRTEPDPPAWSSIVTILNPVTRCWIETKFSNTPGYLDRFIGYFKYFENNPQLPQPEVADESLIYEEYDTSIENFDDEDLEIENSVYFEEGSNPSQANWSGQDNENVFGHEEWEQKEIPSPDHESFVEQIFQFLKPGVLADKVKQFLSGNYFNLSLITRFASGQIWNEDHLALEILFHRNPKLKPASLDKLAGIKRLNELHRLAGKHKSALKPLVDSIIRPLFGNPANFQISQGEEPCQVQDLRAEVRSLGPLKGGVLAGRIWYKKDAARSPRKLLTVDSIVVHHMAYNIGNDVKLYKKVGAHYIVTADGQIAQLYDELDYLNSSNGFNPRCIAIEFAGNFADTKYNWWPFKNPTPSRSYLTPSQIRAGRCLLADLKARFPGIKYLYAHRQSYANKEGDPGPDVWFNIAEWAINKFGLTDRLPLPKTGTGQAIPDSWRLARPITLPGGTTAPKLISKEEEIWFETNEEEIESDEYALQSDESINEEWYYNNEMQEDIFESGVSYEIDEQIKNWSKAIDLNRSYGMQLGWNQYYDQINDLLLPYSGQQNVSLGEEAFAQAAAAWQQQQGLTADGIIGPNTWKIMKSLLGSTTPSTSSTSSTPSTPSTSTTGMPVEQSEWLANAIIQSKYSTWQAYKIIRDQVIGWGITTPASYVVSAIQEWDANKTIQAHFGSFDGDPKKGGHQNSYLNLKRLYQNKGIPNPASYFASNIVSMKFFNKSTPIHKDLKKVLDTAQANLVAGGYNFTFADAYSFVPRTLNYNLNTLSNHAMGKAIDINYKENAHIRSAAVIAVINAVCQTILPGGLLAERNPDVIKRASDNFKALFNASWISSQTNKTLLDQIRQNRAELDRYARTGFMNLPGVLIREIQSAGASWGGSWTGSKDFMHFEI